MATLKLPGMIDIHVHLRDPGATHKEDFSTGTAAALAGGVVAVLDMPNNTPPTVDEETLRQKFRLASRKARCDFGFYLGASPDNAGPPLATYRAAGLKMYLNETYGPLRIEALSAVMAHFRHWPKDKPIAAHAEELFTAMVIGLGQLYDRAVHICHVSTRAQIELIKRAKARGVKITCEVTPHHLFLTDQDAQKLRGFGHVKPALGSREDREALWANLAIVDAVASDHAPHTVDEKESKTAPPGVPGLETTLPLLLDAVAEGRLSLERMIELTHHAPSRIIGAQASETAYIEVDPDAEQVLQGAQLHTKCRWTPFEGMKLRGVVRRVYLRGVRVYEDGELLAPPGFGKPLSLSSP